LKGNKAEMVYVQWTLYKKRWRRAGLRHGATDKGEQWTGGLKKKWIDLFKR
jgi:hypothetical protein